MAKEKHTFKPVLDLIDLVDIAFERLTGEKISDRFKAASSRPRELPLRNEPAPTESGMTLANAYAVLGLKPGASAQDVKTHYRNLAKVFHSDKGGMNDEAMKLLNRAHDMLTRRVK